MKIDTSSNDHLVVRLEGWEQLAAFHIGPLRIPTEQIVRAHADVPVHGWRRLRIPGSFIPGVIQAGTYIWTGVREFWFAHRGHGSRVVIELKAYACYDRVILGVDDGLAEAARINEWLGAN